LSGSYDEYVCEDLIYLLLDFLQPRHFYARFQASANCFIILFVAYARIKTFSSIAGIYYNDNIINVKTPKFLMLFRSYWLT